MAQAPLLPPDLKALLHDNGGRDIMHDMRRMQRVFPRVLVVSRTAFLDEIIPPRFGPVLILGAAVFQIQQVCGLRKRVRLIQDGSQERIDVEHPGACVGIGGGQVST